MVYSYDIHMICTYIWYTYSWLLNSIKLNKKESRHKRVHGMWFHKWIFSTNCKKYNNRQNSSMLFNEQHSKVGGNLGKVLSLDQGTCFINVFSLWKFVDSMCTLVCMLTMFQSKVTKIIQVAMERRG